jgi:hypothetical protein
MPRNIAAPNKPTKPLIRLRNALVTRRTEAGRSNDDSADPFSALPEITRGTRAGLHPPPGSPSLPEDRV